MLSRGRFTALLIVAMGTGTAGSAFAQAKLVQASTIPDPKGSPDILGILRLGTRSVSGTVPAGSKDGAAAPGEALLIQGSNFGKNPEVTVAGQKPEVLGRTADGGIVVRVPPSTPVGERLVIVKTGKGEPSNRGMRFHRFALVSIPKEKKVHAVEMGEASSRRAVAFPIDDPADLRFSPDGSTGYILNGKKGGEWKVHVIDMTPLANPAQKSVVMQRKTDVTAMLVARARPVMVLIDAQNIEVWDLAAPLAPRKLGAAPLPSQLEGISIQTADISPDGKTVAVLGSAKNKFLLLRIDDKGGVEVAGPAMDALTGATTEHAVRSVRFSPDGGTAWVVSGPNPNLARAQKKELTRLSSITIPPTGAPGIVKHRVLKGAKAPRDFVATWGKLTGDGTFDAKPPEDVAMVMAAAPDKLFDMNPKELADPAGRKRLLKIIGTEANPGLLYRMNAKGGEPVGLKMSVILLDVDIMPDSSRVVCFGLNTRAEGEDVEFEVGVASAPALATPKDGILQTGFLPLTKITPDELKAPFRYGEVRVQP